MSLLSPETLLALLMGSLYGIIFGSIPGLTVTLALSLALPVLLFLGPETAVAAVIGISAAAIFAGDIGSVIARVPGTPASAAYTEEIHDIAQERSPGYALGIAALGSAIGSLIGLGFLVIGSFALVWLAKQFSSFEYFWLILLGIASGIFGVPSMLKGIVAFGIGMLLGTIGYDPALGYPRFTFGLPALLGGLDFIVALIAFFGVSEVLWHIYQGHHHQEQRLRQFSRRLSLLKDFYVESARLCWKARFSILRSATIGTLVGFLPGAGSDLAAWINSNLMRLRKCAKEDVVLAGTSSNNAAVAGAWIPAMALGLPGDTLTAILLGLFLALGITPGTDLFQRYGQLVISVYMAFFLASVVIIPLGGYFAAALASVVTHIPVQPLIGAVLGLCILGAYAVNNNPFDLMVLSVLGLFGFLLRQGGFPIGLVVLGMVLGPLLERNFMVSMIKTHWDLTSFFDRPVAIILALATLGLILGMLWARYKMRVRVRAGPAQEE
jgi:putative tricarboxylic transport membrane protein